MLGIRLLVILFLAAACALSGCDKTRVGQSDKVTFELSHLDGEGLYGPPDGRRALDYEFCIPASEECAREVAAIDTTVVILRSSPGRIGCGSGEYLCIGNTHQKRFRDVLAALARLEYVGRIDECVFE